MTCGSRFFVGLVLLCLVTIGQIWGATIRSATEDKVREKKIIINFDHLELLLSRFVQKKSFKLKLRNN